MKEVKTIKRLYEAGLEIVEANNLYNISKTIPKGKSGSFNEMVRQNVNPGIYKQWWLEVEDIFASNSLNYLRFKKKILSHDPTSNYGVGHAGHLVMALEELEKIIDSDKYLGSYKLSVKKPQQWSKVHYENGTVSQGGRFHTYSNVQAVEMINKLWEKRRVISPDKTLIKEGESMPWSNFPKSIQSNIATVQTINKPMREKRMTLRVTHPKKLNGLLLVVTEKRTN